jgi:iron complex outermembrane receptor protein
MAPTSGDKELCRHPAQRRTFSFDLRRDLDVVIRLAPAASMARPDYAQMAGFTSLTPSPC